ncbi:MAG: gamma-glutamylcyclotransferase [Devosia sp.]
MTNLFMCSSIRPELGRHPAGWLDENPRPAYPLSMNPWVFGYGSLIWNPGFAFLRQERALLRGAHRSLSIYSHRHRGTPEQPGLVFGLSRGGSCFGVAFEVAEASWDQVFDYLQDREQDSGVYRETWRKVELAGGETVTALAYLVDERHPQFAGRLSLTEQVRLVARSTGQSGRNANMCEKPPNTCCRWGSTTGRYRKSSPLSTAISG